MKELIQTYKPEVSTKLKYKCEIVLEREFIKNNFKKNVTIPPYEHNSFLRNFIGILLHQPINFKLRFRNILLFYMIYFDAI